LHRISGLEVGLVWLLVVFMTDFWLVSCLVVVLRELQLVCACMHGNGLIYEGWTLCSEFLPTMTHHLFSNLLLARKRKMGHHQAVEGQPVTSSHARATTLMKNLIE
jgi:hypothetical protein